jgi:hypothetical protein
MCTMLEYLDGIKFRQKQGLFKNFIDKWMYIKNTESGAKKALAKANVELMLR